jgi:hypothetical protein
MHPWITHQKRKSKRVIIAHFRAPSYLALLSFRIHKLLFASCFCCWSQELDKYVPAVVCNGMNFLRNFEKFGQLVQRLDGGIYRDTQIQHCDFISLEFFNLIKENGPEAWSKCRSSPTSKMRKAIDRCAIVIELSASENSILHVLWRY